METGNKYILEHTVTPGETADNIGSGGLPVFATPAMAALMEKAAYTLAREHGEETVGTRLEISHSRACLPGTALAAEAEITETEGRKILFRVKVVLKILPQLIVRPAAAGNQSSRQKCCHQTFTPFHPVRSSRPGL